MFNLDWFPAFSRQLILDSKEDGRCRFQWIGSQHRFFNELQAGLSEDVHRFVVLKARQLGITTIGLALDLGMAMMFPGLRGALAVNSEGVRDNCREIWGQYLRALPRAYRVPEVVNNRTEMRFKNGSRFAHLIAGGRNSGALGRSQGINFLHATEISSWSDPEGVVSLDAALASRNPSRLYFYESTARGYNVFRDMWEDAVRSKATRAVFIGWWANERYAIPRDNHLWKTYGRERLRHDEIQLARQVKKEYGHEITLEQWAWWRWKWTEASESPLLFAEFPFTADQAFVMTGSAFFRRELLHTLAEDADGAEYGEWTYELSTNFADMKLVQAPGGDLCIWEEPVDGCDYVIAADPAYGSSDWADQFCVQVLKCTAFHVEQVAEFASPDCTSYGFAWILAHLCGAYSSPGHSPTLILELTGPGRPVLDNLQKLQTEYGAAAAGLSDSQRRRLLDVFGSIQNYLYRRPDTFGAKPLVQWETSYKTKPLMMNALRDALERRQITVRSLDALHEMEYVEQNGSRIQSEGRNKDDRVVALALGVMAWIQQVAPRLPTHDPDAPNPSAVSRSVEGFLARVQSQAESMQDMYDGGGSWDDD